MQVKKALKNWLSFKRNSLFLLFLTGCGYHLGPSNQPICISTCIEGDRDGFFTKALIHQIETKNNLTFSNGVSDYRLEVCVLPSEDDTIGYKFAPHNNKILTPEEARLRLAARVSLIDLNTGRKIFGPAIVSSAITYDFESDFTNLNFHAFSLGQLEMRPLAQDDAFCPLYQLLAQKIVDCLSINW